MNHCLVLPRLRIKDIKLAIRLAKALAKDANYVNYDYRKEQLWENLQTSTELLLQNDQLK